jgi:hypothetical protein
MIIHLLVYLAAWIIICSSKPPIIRRAGFAMRLLHIHVSDTGIMLNHIQTAIPQQGLKCKNIAITDERYVHIEEMERVKLLGQISSVPVRQHHDDLQGMLVKLDNDDLHRAITIAAGLLVKR